MINIEQLPEITNTPEPPYYAVIFTSLLTEVDSVTCRGYEEMANKMLSLASNQTGFLGAESVRKTVGITVSYWSDLESIKVWKENTEHLVAQQKGREIWYQQFKVRISKVERDYGFNKKE